MVRSVDTTPEVAIPYDVIETADAMEKAARPSTLSEKTASDREESGQGILVDFDGEGDLSNPQNWSPKLKWSLIVLVSALDFAVQVSHAPIKRNRSC